MASVFKKTFTKPAPAGAETFTRKGVLHARFQQRGKTRTERASWAADGSLRLLLECATYTVRYRDGAGVVREVATGCKSKDAAMAVLNDLVARAEKVKAGVLTATEVNVSDWQSALMERHITDYKAHLAARGVTERHRKERGAQLTLIFNECGFARLRDLDRTAFEKWLNAKEAKKMSARRRNIYATALIAFCNWAVSAHRLMVNPFARLRKANEQADRRRVRRALTEAELNKLLDAAQRRPLHDKLHGNRGDEPAELSDDTIASLKRLGRERALIYKTLALTGLRRGELASITVGQVRLDGSAPYLALAADSEKSRRGARIALRADLAADI